jgi:putative endonuclease
MPYFVYAIHNEGHGKIYIGQTHNLKQRLKSHNDKFYKNHFTAQFDGDWRLIYSEEISSLKEALRREKQLKSFQGRQYIKQFIPRD